MSYLLGYYSVFFIISFLIVTFIVKKVYLKKTEKKMSKAQITIWTIGIGLVLVLVNVIQRCIR